MPTLGLYDRFVIEDPNAFSIFAPVSCWPSLILQSNLQHIITQQTQVRINWKASVLAGTGRDGFIVDNTGAEAPIYQALYVQEFELTWIDDQHPVGIDVVMDGVVDGLPGDPGVSVIARIIPANYPINDQSDGIELFGVATSMNETSGAGVIDAHVKPGSSAGLSRIWRPFSEVQERPNGDLFFSNPSISLARIEIMLTAPEDTTLFGITGLKVQEFFA